MIFKELQTSCLDIKKDLHLPAYFAVLLALISLQIIKNDNYDIPLAYFFFAELLS